MYILNEQISQFGTTDLTLEIVSDFVEDRGCRVSGLIQARANEIRVLACDQLFDEAADINQPSLREVIYNRGTIVC